MNNIVRYIYIYGDRSVTSKHVVDRIHAQFFLRADFQDREFYSRCDLRVRLLHKSRIIEIPSPSLSIIQWTIFKKKWISSPRKMNNLVVMIICVLTPPPPYCLILVLIPCLAPPTRVLLLKNEPSPYPHVSLCWRNRELWSLFFFLIVTLPRR